MSVGSHPVPTPSSNGVGQVPLSMHIDRVVTELAGRFPAVPPETLRTVVIDEFQEFDGAVISTFIPVLVAKAVTVRLTRGGTPGMANTYSEPGGWGSQQIPGGR